MNSMVKVFLVGAGPGDPELLTLKALRLMQAADVILYDSLVDKRILTLAGARPRRVDVGKRCGAHSASQLQITGLLVAEAIAGHNVVRLKGGDPMIFGRATEEMDALSTYGIPFEVVPGVTAATAAAASIGQSLTKRGVSRSVHFLTGHGADGGLPAHDWAALTKSGGTLVVYMGGRTLSGLAWHFIEAGMPPSMPAIVVENASLANERVIHGTIGTLPREVQNANCTGPALVMIGEALREPAALREALRAVSERAEV